jgi:uncharacterized membrane protein
MMGLLDIATFAAALGTGVAAGVFFTFSTFVMRGLSRLPAEQGMAAMQAINVTAINPWFMGVWAGTGLVCVAVIVLSASHLGCASGFRVAGALAYLVGSIGVTIAFNVPRNNALGAISAASPAAPELWASYLREWCAWNHVRTVTSIIASAALLLAVSR